MTFLAMASTSQPVLRASPNRVASASRLRLTNRLSAKFAIEFTDLGEQSLRNIGRPVRAYAVVSEGSGGATRTRGETPGPHSVRRLSIVVLPFANLGGDPEQDYFVDGITESLTTDLSRINGSFVIARNTAFTFKGKAMDVQKLCRELNVRYVLEGSVQRGTGCELMCSL
jgi:hypothetical protein